jgi:hypothetical protein
MITDALFNTPTQKKESAELLLPKSACLDVATKLNISTNSLTL